jgi:Tfp pilus assembly pilus retraction ATPase PilT
MSENLPTAPESGPLATTGRLRDLDFTDLFFSERGEAFVRGMEEGDGPLSGVPESVVDDLDELHRRVCDLGQSKAEFFLDYDNMRFRVSRIEDVDGIWYTLRRAKWPIPRLGELGGIPARVVEYLGYLGKPTRPNPHGLILIAGATGNGKTTTACSLLQEYLLWFGDVAVTLEDPIELPLNGPHGRFGHCFQIPVEDGDFGTAMKRTMRRSPRYILLGEVRSPVEASQALRAAINGHLVITTIHAGGVAEAINAMLKFVSGAEPMELARSILADGLIGVVHQQLIRSRVKGKGRMLKLEYLFPAGDKGIRSLIRSGKTEQLVTAIELQATRVAQGKPPVGD